MWRKQIRSRYTDRVEQYRQNRLFGFNQSKFYAKLDKEPSDEYIPQNPQDAKDFWSGIWSNESGHRKDAEWLKELRSETVVNCQDDMTIDIDKLKAALKTNWKAPGPDLVQGFWLKNKNSMHTRLVDQLNMSGDRGSSRMDDKREDTPVCQRYELS